MEEHDMNESKTSAVTLCPHLTWSYVPANLTVGQNNIQQSIFFIIQLQREEGS